MATITRTNDIFREKDDDRLLLRLSAVAGADLGPGGVKRLAEGDLSLVKDLGPAAQNGVMSLLSPLDEALGVLEKTVGASLDYVPVAFLDRARAASLSVVRVLDRDRHPLGTGVMISNRLVMTNNHVTPTAHDAMSQSIQFRYELEIDGLERETTTFSLDPTTFFFSSPIGELDVSIVAIGRRIGGRGESEEFGFAPLSSAMDKHAEGDFVTVIQHPEGDFKQIALRENRVVGRGGLGFTLHYGADTLGGSSGSPVYNDQFELVALHHAGGRLNDRTLDDGRDVPSESNEGIRISAIVAALLVSVDKLPSGQRDLLLAAVDTASAPPAALLPLTGGSAASFPAAQPESASGVSVNWSGGASTLPVEVLVRVGSPAGVGVPAVRFVSPLEDPAVPSVLAFGVPAIPGISSLEKNSKPHPVYSNRRGYSPRFLGPTVHLPELAPEIVGDAAKLTDGSGDIQLRYVHFTVVQNAKRRMPFFTAVNIDGKRARGINRETGEVEATETWYVDPRLHPDQQLDQSTFEKQKPRIFDRGHMVRRLDPAWGSASIAVRASDDTFHFTNCCPQVANFNQSAKLWQGIENFVLDTAKALDDRITVFTGPIFGPQDPPYRERALVPKSFWKVLVRFDPAGGLRATGFIADQSKLLTVLEGGVERVSNWDELGKVAQFQVAVSDIERRTSLSLGKLKDFDTHSGLEAISPISRFDQVSL